VLERNNQCFQKIRIKKEKNELNAAPLLKGLLKTPILRKVPVFAESSKLAPSSSPLVLRIMFPFFPSLFLPF